MDLKVDFSLIMDFPPWKYGYLVFLDKEAGVLKIIKQKNLFLLN